MKVCMEANDNLWRNQGIGEQARNLFETRCPEGFPFERPMSVFNFDRKYKSFLLRSIGGRQARVVKRIQNITIWDGLEKRPKNFHNKLQLIMKLLKKRKMTADLIYFLEYFVVHPCLCYNVPQFNVQWSFKLGNVSHPRPIFKDDFRLWGMNAAYVERKWTLWCSPKKEIMS